MGSEPAENDGVYSKLKEHMEIAIIITFILGYLFITLEHSININKAATALLTGVLCWTLYVFSSSDTHLISQQLTGHLGEIAGIIFLLMGAMTIVELIDAHDGFEVITNAISTTLKGNAEKLIAVNNDDKPSASFFERYWLFYDDSANINRQCKK